MKPAVVFQPLSKVGVSTFVVSNTMSFIVVFPLMGEQTRLFDFCWDNTKEGGVFYRDKEVLIKKAFHLTRKENIEKTRKALRKPGKLSLPL